VPRPTLRLVAALAPVVGGALLAAAALEPPLFRALVREDSILEWLEVIAWAAAAVAAAILVRRGEWLWAFVALGAVLVVGEELSWGQRLLDYGTPTAFQDGDKQEEASVHNVRSFETPVRLVAIAVPAAAVRFVPWFLAPAFLVTAGYELVRLFLGDSPGYTVAKWSEWPELCFAAGIAGAAVLRVRSIESRSCQTS
jgi:hypothetical protein